MFKYSYDSLVYMGEGIEKSIKRVAKFGYDAIEIVGEPSIYKSDEINKLCNDNGIVVSSICSIFSEERDMINIDSKIRKQGVDYVKSLIDFASEMNCYRIIVSTQTCGKKGPVADIARETSWAIENVSLLADYALPKGITLCLESWNRYETYMADSLNKVSVLAKKINKPNVGIMGDTFHMNIEEADMAGSIRKYGDQLVHMHIADSNRTAPGSGHIDFSPIIQALRDVNYNGYLSFELLPAGGDPFAVMRAGGCPEFFDKYTEQAIKWMKKIECELC